MEIQNKDLELSEDQKLLKTDIEEALADLEKHLKIANEKLAKHNLILDLQADFRVLPKKEEN